MRISSTLRTGLVALIAIVGAGLASAAYADSGTVRLSIVKGGWFIGGSGGNGTLTFKGRRYPLSVGGLNAGLLFGAAQVDLSGRVSNIRRASDIAGTYGSAGVGAAVGLGAGVVRLRNEKGAVLDLSGRQIGLIANADLGLGGMTIALR